MDNCGHAGAVFVFECGSVGRPSKNNQSRINSSNMFHQLTHISTLEIFFGKWLIEGTKCSCLDFVFVFCFGELIKSDINYILKLWFIEPVSASLCLLVKIIQKRQQLQTSGEKKLSKELLLEKLQTKYFVRNYEPHIEHHRWYLFTGHREEHFLFSWDWNHFLQRQ